MYPSSSSFQLLPLLALLFSTTLFTSIDSQCSSILERKEWRTLSDPVKSTYLKANLRLQVKKAADGKVVFDSFANMHNTLNPRIHGNAVFLPWHRWFLYQFEKQIQAESSSSTFVPYWSTSLDSQALDLAPVFGSNDTTFGGWGDARTGCVTTGPFKTWKPSVPNSHCLQRATTVQPIGAIPPVDILAKDIAESKDFQTLAFVAEGNIHAYVHMRIGMDMSTMFSPNDPLFYLHHANVDKVWWTWQKQSAANLRSYGGANSFHVDANSNRIPATLQSELPGYPGIRVQQVLDTTTLCYTYKEITTNDLKPPSLPPPQVVPTPTPPSPVTPPVNPPSPVTPPVNPVTPPVNPVTPPVNPPVNPVTPPVNPVNPRPVTPPVIPVNPVNPRPVVPVPVIPVNPRPVVPVPVIPVNPRPVVPVNPRPGFPFNPRPNPRPNQRPNIPFLPPQWNDWFDQGFNRGRQRFRLNRRDESNDSDDSSAEPASIDDPSLESASTDDSAPLDGNLAENSAADASSDDLSSSDSTDLDDSTTDDVPSKFNPVANANNNETLDSTPVASNSEFDEEEANKTMTEQIDSSLRSANETNPDMAKAEGDPYKIIELDEHPTQIPANDMSNLLDLREIEPLPSHWIKLNQLNETRIREYEAKMKQTIGSLNKLDGYVSTCALWNRPDMLVRLVEQKRVETFYAVVNNTKVEVDVTNNGSLQAVSDVIHRVTVALNGTVTKPIEQVAPKLEKLIGPPVFGKNCILNPYSPRIDLPVYRAPPSPSHQRRPNNPSNDYQDYQDDEDCEEDVGQYGEEEDCEE